LSLQDTPPNRMFVGEVVLQTVFGPKVLGFFLPGRFRGTQRPGTYRCVLMESLLGRQLQANGKRCRRYPPKNGLQTSSVSQSDKKPRKITPDIPPQGQGILERGGERIEREEICDEIQLHCLRRQKKCQCRKQAWPWMKRRGFLGA